jgi:hypothetical protein
LDGGGGLSLRTIQSGIGASSFGYCTCKPSAGHQMM